MKQFKTLLESLPAKTVVFAFGRFSPPSVGHGLLVEIVKKLAHNNRADHIIYASRTQDKKKNPLSIEKKMHYLKMMFPKTNFAPATEQQRTFIEVAKYLNIKYKNLIMVAGSDRIPEYQRILSTYNGKEFHFDSIKVISAGERDPDSDDISGMSASKLRAAAVKGDFGLFKKGMPSHLRDIDIKHLMNDVRLGMGLEIIKEQISFKKDNLREKYISGELFTEGCIVESKGEYFEILKCGTNYLTVLDKQGLISKKWLHECKLSDANINFDGVKENMRYKDLIKHNRDVNEELSNKTVKSSDKIKVARVIADMLGVENAESLSPDQAIANAFRKIKSKRMTPELIGIVKKMVHLANEVGIKINDSMLPAQVSEAMKVGQKPDDVNTKREGEDITEPGHTLDQGDQDHLRRMKQKFKTEEKKLDAPTPSLETIAKKHNVELDYLKKQLEKGIETEKEHSSDENVAKEIALDHLNEKPDYYVKLEKYVESIEESKMSDLHLTIGQHLDKHIANYKKNGGAEHLGQKTVETAKKISKSHGLEHKHAQKFVNDYLDSKLNEDMKSADYTVNPQTGRSMKAKHITFTGSHLGGRLGHDDDDDDSKVPEQGSKPGQTKDLLKQVKHPSAVHKAGKPNEFNEDVEDDEEDIPEEELDSLANSIDREDHILDLYDPEEFAVVDTETGEEIEDEVNESEQLQEVLSRMERIKAKMRFARSKSKRERKIQIALRTRSSQEKLNGRARKLAVKMMKQRIAKKSPDQMSVAEKERVERIVAKRKGAINRLAMKLVPRIKKIESERLSHHKVTK